jgi:hypothetical protein
VTVQELINQLSKYPKDTQVMLLDGHNGGGCLRTLNFGPVEKEVMAQNVRDSVDCEGLEGTTVVVMGYGCY